MTPSDFPCVIIFTVEIRPEILTSSYPVEEASSGQPLVSTVPHWISYEVKIPIINASPHLNIMYPSLKDPSEIDITVMLCNDVLINLVSYTYIP